MWQCFPEAGDSLAVERLSKKTCGDKPRGEGGGGRREETKSTWEKRSDMAGAAPPPKQDELVPHPVKDQLANVSFCITSPPPWRKLFVFRLFFPFIECYLLPFLQLLCLLNIIVNSSEAILLGFQHYLVMLGTTVIIPTALVPQMGGGNVAKCVEIGLPAIVLLVIFSQGIGILLDGLFGTANGSSVSV
ncbi:hypothetical protein GW17_00002186 [Ensete ventricosum]|nr:hypothetical protein GW17_00002186 [Ensete ventricosum]